MSTETAVLITTGAAMVFLMVSFGIYLLRVSRAEELAKTRVLTWTIQPGMRLPMAAGEWQARPGIGTITWVGQVDVDLETEEERA